MTVKTTGRVSSGRPKLPFPPSSECQPWPGTIGGNGYGSTYHEGKWLDAHRKAWILAYGPIPPGKHVLHSCDNPPCVNINHLFLGDAKLNARDREAKKRGRWSKPAPASIRLEEEPT